MQMLGPDQKQPCHNCALLQPSSSFLSCSLEQLRKNLIVRHYRPGQCILSQGAVPESFFCSANGAIDAIHYDRAGEQRLVLRLKRQTLFPNLPFKLRNPRSMSFLARAKSVLCAFPASTIFDLYEKDPAFREFVVETLADRFRALTDRTLMLLSPTAAQKVAGAIYSYREQENICRATQSEISEWTRLAPETVSRCISLLLQKKLIRKATSHLVILDVEELRKFIEI